MELLYFIGKDTPINIITSSSQHKILPPTYNIHVKTGGIDINEIKTSLANDNDQYNDIFYIVVPESFIPQFQVPSIKWILSRKHANVYHILLCDVNLYDTLSHKSYFNSLKSEKILQQIFNCHSPYARILSCISCIPSTTHVDQTIDKKIIYQPSTTTLFVDIDTNANAKLYAGLILDTHKNLKGYNPEFIVDASNDLSLKEDGYAFIYTFDLSSNDSKKIKVMSKRPLSQILMNYNQLTQIQNIQLVCRDINFPNAEIIAQLDQNLFPYTCVKEYNSCKNIITMYDDVKIENLPLFLNTIRKLPLFSSFTKVIFNSIANILFDEVINDIFVTINPEEDSTKSRCFLETQSQMDEMIIVSLIPSCGVSKLPNATIDQHQKPKYFIEKFGNDDLAEQMTQFSCVVKAFHPLVDASKDKWKDCKIKDVFQNIDYDCSNDVENNFTLAYYPSPHPYIFSSFLRYQAINYLSFFTSRGIKVVGVHQKRKRLGVTPTQKCNLKYYKDAIESIKQHFESSEIHFLLFNDFLNLKEICGSYTLVKETDGLSLAILSLCDSLILSTSSFSWWAGTLNKKAIIYAPKKWIEPSLFSSDLERKFSTNDWNQLEN